MRARALPVSVLLAALFCQPVAAQTPDKSLNDGVQMVEEGEFDTAIGMLDSVVKQQELALLHRALRELPEDKRELIVLSRFQGLTYEQIGQIVGCETGTVKVRVFRAMKEMGRIYDDLEREKAS